MRALDKKLVRDLWQMKGQALAICLVLACGVATFVMSLSAISSLRHTLDTYYERYRFAHAFAHLKRAPNALAARIAEIPGVTQVQTRVVESVTLDVAGMTEPAVGQLVSVPDRPAPGLNALHLCGGRYPEPGRKGETLVSEAFAEAHGLKPGDGVVAILNGRKQRLRIVGVALSPEYVYQIRPGDLLPDNKRFGVFWMGYTELAAAFDMQGAFNDVAVTLAPGASEPGVLDQLDRLTAPYGGLGAHGRQDQPSHKFIANELEELRGMAVVVPAIFLCVAAFLLHVVLSRLVGTQREQIAALKAFGYTDLEVGVHYLKLVLLIVLAGVALGTAVGLWLGRGVTELYTRFFRFPVFAFRADAWSLLLPLLISGATGLAGTLGAVRRATRLAPAEAMRPEPPAFYRPTLIERAGVQRLFPPAARMVLRNLERQPVRALLSAAGIALGVAVLILGNFMVDAVDYVLESEFRLSQRQDVQVALVEPAAVRALYEVRHLPGVMHGEPYRGLPVRLRRGHRSRRVAVVGLRPGGELHRLIDVRRLEVTLPPDGLVLSDKLAEVLGVSVGETVQVEVLEGERPIREVMVAGLVADFTGVSAYLDLRACNRLMKEGPVVSGAFVTADPSRLDALYRELKNTPRVGAVVIKGAALRAFEQTVAENLLRMRLFNVIFASVITCGVVYNSARISLSERSRELATLRVIGFTRGEISLILLGELAVLVLVAIPAGLALGYGLGGLVIRLAYDTELFRMPLIVSRWTYGFAAAVTLAAAVLSGLLVRRLLDRLDLVAVLKSRE
jgi:putative ABC transport system permease protein